MDYKLEVLVLPVSDVDRARAFYEKLGFRLDIDYVASEAYRVAQFTPSGSGCSIIIGKGISDAVPGSVQGLHLVVNDIVKARDELIGRGITVGEVFHEASGVFHHAGTAHDVPGPDPKRGDYASFAKFADPDGNGWVLQEIRVPGPGRATKPRELSREELTALLRGAEAAHGEYERTVLKGVRDEQWAPWYAEWMANELRK
jgi:catechol 2,3-dioxygenase-like lactoylglutathione lyase family enzyme